jgi:hypothetical protein
VASKHLQPGVLNTKAVDAIQQLLEKVQKTRDKSAYLAQIDALSQLAQGLAAFEQTVSEFWRTRETREKLEQDGAARTDVAVATKAENKAIRQHSRNCEKLQTAMDAARALLKPVRRSAAA